MGSGESALAPARLPFVWSGEGLFQQPALFGPFALSIGLHAALLFVSVAGILGKPNQNPLGILVERYGVPGAGVPAISEVDISYDAPSDVSLGKKKKKTKVIPAASQVPSEGNAGGGKLGNTTTGAASGVMGDPNGIVVSTRARYLYELKVFFDQRKQYPSAARTLGQTGQVAVAFEIQKDGTFSNIVVVGPTAFDRLNLAALALVRGAGRFKPLPPELENSPWKLTVPIRYELN